MIKRRAALLPLYLELYDLVEPQSRARCESFLATITLELEKRGLELLRLPVCRLEIEFAEAIRQSEESRVDAIITLHLAYSPSLESVRALTGTKLPLIVLDTTPAYNFGPTQSMDEVMFNHGIHGVQDMCNLLRRNGKPFFIEAGHWLESDVLDRVTARVSGAVLAARMRKARVGSVGGPFKGMGDFAIPAESLHADMGVQIVVYDFTEGLERIRAVDEAAIDEEMGRISAFCETAGLVPEVFRESVRTGLALRDWIQTQRLTAFTVNFLATDKQPGLPRMPFLEASLAMARGIGYAGEGDALTAALVGTLLSVFPETTFTEMFCPDWEHNAIFLSHMGEMNLSLMDAPPRLVEENFTYTSAGNPVLACGRLKAGAAWIANLAPYGAGLYVLILVPVTVRAVQGEDRMQNSVHGWFEPRLPVAQFLQEYSLAGGTHHIALTYGDARTGLETFGQLMGWKVRIIG